MTITRPTGLPIGERVSITLKSGKVVDAVFLDYASLHVALRVRGAVAWVSIHDIENVRLA